MRYNLQITVNHADNSETNGLGCVGSWEDVVEAMASIRDIYNKTAGPDLRATSFVFVVTVQAE